MKQVDFHKLLSEPSPAVTAADFAEDGSVAFLSTKPRCPKTILVAPAGTFLDE